MKLQAWEEGRLPHCWGQCLSRRRILGGPPASMCCFHLSDFWLRAAGAACLQPGQQDQSRHEPNKPLFWDWVESELSRAAEATLISVVSHSVRDDTFESTGSVGVGGVKQTVRSWVWEARRQTERFLSIHILHRGGLFKPDPAKVVEAENVIQNPFSWAGWFGFSSPPLPHMVSPGRVGRTFCPKSLTIWV